MTSNPNLAAGIIAFMHQRGVCLSTRGIYLHVDVPRGAITSDMTELLRSTKADVIHELRLREPCTHCGAEEHVDRPIHGGQSTRRDCLVCGHTKGFPVWYGRSY